MRPRSCDPCQPVSSGRGRDVAVKNLGLFFFFFLEILLFILKVRIQLRIEDHFGFRTF